MSLDLNGVGLSLDDLDLDDFADDLPALPLPLDRPRWRKAEWWETSEAESHFLDLPPFQSAQNRASYMIRQMGRAALANLNGATAEDAVFEHGGKMMSLNALLSLVGRDVVDEALSRL